LSVVSDRMSRSAPVHNPTARYRGTARNIRIARQQLTTDN
jgi:hypothetical protein